MPKPANHIAKAQPLKANLVSKPLLTHPGIAGFTTLTASYVHIPGAICQYQLKAPIAGFTNPTLYICSGKTPTSVDSPLYNTRKTVKPGRLTTLSNNNLTL
jgi:hypothetical protein